MSEFCRLISDSATSTDYDYGIILVGDNGVGKSSLVNLMINIVLNRKLDNLIIAMPTSSYPIVSSFLINDQKPTAPKIYEFSGALTNRKKIRIFEIPGNSSSTLSIEEHLANQFSIVSRYFSFINVIGILEKNSTVRLSNEKMKFYSAVEKNLTQKCLANNCCFFVTFFLDNLIFNTDWVGIKAQKIVKLNNLIFSCSLEKYKENSKIRKRNEAIFTSMEKKLTKFFNMLVGVERVSFSMPLEKQMNITNLREEIKIDQQINNNTRGNNEAEQLAREKREREEDKKKFNEELNFYKDKLKEANDKCLTLDADLQKYKKQSEDIKFKFESSAKNLQQAETENKKLSQEKSFLYNQKNDTASELNTLKIRFQSLENDNKKNSQEKDNIFKEKNELFHSSIL